MVSLQSLHSFSDVEPGRISFSSEFLDESNFISICPNPQAEREAERARIARNADFEFLSGNVLTNMMSADELFREGKLLPSWQTHHADKLNKISLKSESNDTEPKKIEKIEDSRIWFLDDDPSPRPPKCTVLWKELLKLKKQRRPSTLSPSTSSSSSSSSRTSSLADVPFANERESVRNKEREKAVKRMKKGSQEKTRSKSIRIRPVLNVPICTQAKNNVLPPLFSLRKGRLDQVK
ncbi:hypothetical protein ACS0TY_014110 [Phlomoides rotata]